MAQYPHQQPPQGGYQNNETYGYPPPPYSNESAYGPYNPGEGQAYGQNPNYQAQSYGGEGQAQSYYGSNEQPYQQYPSNQYGGGYERPQYQGTPPPSHMQPQNYGSQYAPPEYPPYGQQYPPRGSSQADDFTGPNEQPQGTDGDRGVMGALAGGAAGAYGGHKVHHGFLGGVGGAVAGSMLEDAYKKHHKKEKQHKRRGSGSSSSSSSSSSSDDEKRQHGSPPTMAGNFSASSRHARLEPPCTLVAECTDVDGHHRWAHLDLNGCFTNTNGRLLWARGGNFAASSRHIRLTEDGRALEAELGDGRGHWVHNKVWLNERITNDNGRLALI